MQLTRRTLAAALLVSPSAALAQNPAPAPADPLEAARQNLRQHLSKLAAIDVPMTAEPAFQFKA